MIEINLLPGSRKASRRSVASFDVRGAVAGLSGRFADRWLVGAIAAGVLAVLTIAGLWFQQSAKATRLAEAEAAAVADSARMSSVLAERIGAEARRDTTLRQLNIIRAIDEDRFLWPHVLEEVSRALPPYTWLTQLAYTGNAVQPPAALPKDTATAPDTSAAARRRKRKRLPTEITRDTVRILISGSTVDIQALTRFMKQLEASPFLMGIDLKKSTVVAENNREVTNFELDAIYERPDSSVIRRVPLRLAGGR